MKKPARALPLVKRRVEALLKKAQSDGCKPQEQELARAKAHELITRYDLDPGSYEDLAEPSVLMTLSSPEADLPIVETASVGRKRLGIGNLARELILEYPGWTYKHIAEEINARIEGAQATHKSICFYSYEMRKLGIEGTSRQRRGRYGRRRTGRTEI